MAKAKSSPREPDYLSKALDIAIRLLVVVCVVTLTAGVALAQDAVSAAEFVQWAVMSSSLITTFVPGVHRFAVERSPPPVIPPSICASIEAGKSWSTPMLSAD